MSQPTTSLSPSQASDLLRRSSEAIHSYFEQIGNRHRHAPARLVEAMQYSLMAGGKRLRPALVFACCDACLPASARPGEAHRSALAAAGAMELIHTFSLVHDDLPAMDDDDLRRGRPTNHKVFGEAMAILAGDAMVTAAFELLATDAHPGVALPLIRELSRASGAEGMIGGQVLDIDNEQKSLNLDQLQQVHRMKTGALLVASCRMGAIAAGATETQLNAVTDYGQHLGLAFQIVDDVLDVTATAEQMGKATNKDAANGKNTYPQLLGLEPSKREAKRQLEAALAAVAALGVAAEPLRDLARFVVEREV